jgi:hypothetical protein
MKFRGFNLESDDAMVDLKEVPPMSMTETDDSALRLFARFRFVNEHFSSLWPSIALWLWSRYSNEELT